MVTDTSGYYVYLYRDSLTNDIRYVGVGTDRTSGKQRVEDHLTRARATAFRSWLKKSTPSIEVMRCASRQEALAVEAGLISALWTPQSERGATGLFNAVHGHHHQFVPLGLDQSLRNRRYEPPLTRDDLAAMGGVLAVIVSTKDFTERLGAAPRSNLKDCEVSARILGVWQIGSHITGWQQDRTSAPKLLIGVTGPVDRRWVWGSVRLTAKAIRDAERHSGGLYSFPLDKPSVDAGHLRGRRLAADAVGPRQDDSGRRMFGGIRAQFFDVVEPRE